MTDRPVWDDGAWLGFPQLTSRVSADLCVVGLGGSGLRAIEHAVSTGASVVGVDAGTVAGGAAGRNGGFLLAGMALFYHEARTMYGQDRARRFYARTVDEIEAFYDEPGSRQTGSLRIAIDDAETADIEAEYAALTEDGFEVEWYEGPEGSGILIPGNGVCNPMARVRELACSVADAGAQLFERSPVTGIESGLVSTDLGSVEAERVMVAVDGGLETIFPELAGRVRTASLQMLATAPDETVRFSRPVYTNFGYDYFQQLPDGSVALGGGRDRHLDRSWTTEHGLIPEVQDELDRILDRIGVTAPVSHRWAGRVAFTTDSRPIVEEVRPGVVAVGAYSGHGNVVGSICARDAVSQALSGRPIVSPI